MSEIISLSSAASEIQEIFNVIVSLSAVMFKDSLKIKISSVYKNN